MQIQIILMIPMLLFAVIAHEVAHGYVALRCGDQTAKLAGRLTFNPLPHIDVVGTIVLPAILLLTNASFLVGWAKPVPVNPYNLRNPRRDHLLVSLAGVCTNLLLALVCTILLVITIKITGGKVGAFALMLQSGIFINSLLAVFNILPIPPLDGSWVLYHLLPDDLAEQYRRIFPYGFYIIIALFATGLLRWIILPPLVIITQFLDVIMKFML